MTRLAASRLLLLPELGKQNNANLAAEIDFNFDVVAAVHNVDHKCVMQQVYTENAWLQYWRILF